MMDVGNGINTINVRIIKNKYKFYHWCNINNEISDIKKYKWKTHRE